MRVVENEVLPIAWPVSPFEIEIPSQYDDDAEVETGLGDASAVYFDLEVATEATVDHCLTKYRNTATSFGALAILEEKNRPSVDGDLPIIEWKYREETFNYLGKRETSWHLLRKADLLRHPAAKNPAVLCTGTFLAISVVR